MNASSLPPLATLEAGFAPASWAAGEDYVLQDRVQGLRRAGTSLAARVLGVRDDYAVRCALSDPPVSYCSCGRPRCRHAAAIIQAYYSRRVRALDADAVIDAYLRHPTRAPLAAAALGEDLLEAMRLPPEGPHDIASAPEAEAVLRMQQALEASPDRAGLLLALLPRGTAAGPVQDLLRGWLADLAQEPAQWLRFYEAAPLPLLPFLRSIEPGDWGPELRPHLLAALWHCAAQEDPRLPDLADAAARHAPLEAYQALDALVRSRPQLVGPLLAAGAGCGRRGRALAAALSAAAEQDSAVQESMLSEIQRASGDHPGQRAEALLRLAALQGDARALLAARRAAVRAGNWPHLRGLVPDLLRGRADAIVLETRLLLADGDLEGAARAAARSRASSVPERLVAEALRAVSPAEARQHELRADAIAARLGEASGQADGPQRRRPQEERTRPRKD